ncbi:hypothetical protein UK23_43045 [Lentzea aerocolonigenes]|uniref:Uncharacterized protein n=1 Tax=Lentzea aerocolonigenes TaxID=68170 RepID=A0A0F0GIS0_LENAE|nr:hypothetical protein [Lentzea aerocolonigenes]KJK35224.1 hypothetical protein UK23_43045 [Lentzea aerocolonigenes]
MKPWGIVALIAAVLATLAYIVSRPEGNGSTDDSADHSAECLARYPVPDSAASFARRELEPYSQCGGWDVIEYTDLGDRLADTQKPSSRLVIRIHEDEHDAMWTHRDAVTACYRMEFDYFGLAGGPDRVRCPAGAPALLPPGIKHDGVPDNYAEAFKTALSTLPPAPNRDEVLTAVRAKLPPLPIDEHGQPWREPTLDAFVENGEIGITADGTKGQCLEGTRLADGTIKVAAQTPSDMPNAVKTCTAEGALPERKSAK